MATAIHKRASAQRDLVDQYVYLAQVAGIDAAERFLLGTENSFHDLLRHPDKGAPVSLRSGKFAGMRKWQARGVDDVVVFYLPRGAGISIVRVLHASRDWWSLVGLG